MFSFRNIDKRDMDNIAPELFRILSENMSAIAPTGNSFDDDYQMWSSYVLSDDFWTSDRKIVMMLSNDEIVGYFQYCVHGDILTVEEVEIEEKYQRTALFGRFLRYIKDNMPPGVRYIEAYVNKLNSNSHRITTKLGFKIVGENKNGKSWHYRLDLNDRE